jgi:hypothetical protein
VCSSFQAKTSARVRDKLWPPKVFGPYWRILRPTGFADDFDHVGGPSTVREQIADQRYLNNLNSHMLDVLEKDGRIFLSGTTINGQRALRACSVNHRLRREDVDFLLDVTRQVERSLADL